MRSVLRFPCRAEKTLLTGITGRPIGPLRCLDGRSAAKPHTLLTRALVTGAASLWASAPLPAGTATGSFTVTATVQAVCLMSAGAINFGTYIPGNGTTLTASSNISIQCSSGTVAPTLALNSGSSGGTMAERLMLGPGGAKLQYNLYTSSSYGTVFGDGTGGSATVPVTIGTSSFTTPVQVTVYGQFLDSAANRLAATSGSYSDTVTATLTY
jgi:spore coat protein U-like protein